MSEKDEIKRIYPIQDPLLDREIFQAPESTCYRKVRLYDGLFVTCSKIRLPLITDLLLRF